MNTVQGKRLARSQFRRIRREIPVEIRSHSAVLAAKRLSELDFYQKSDKILVYVSYGDELETGPLIRLALEAEKQVYVPRCSREQRGVMRFYRITDPERDLHPGMYGIPEPAPDTELYPGGGGLCVVPGLAFTPAGYRLGYGGGYYDRFLSDFSGTAVGYCFNEQMAAYIPSDPWDMPLAGVITPGAWYSCSV